MTSRPPRPQSITPHQDALDYEIAQEKAAALGRLGRALEKALAALSEFDRTVDLSAPTKSLSSTRRKQLVQDAGYALWCLIVQREACGLRDPRPVLREYSVPAEVRNRMGVFGEVASRGSTDLTG